MWYLLELLLIIPLYHQVRWTYQYVRGIRTKYTGWFIAMSLIIFIVGSYYLHLSYSPPPLTPLQEKRLVCAMTAMTDEVLSHHGKLRDADLPFFLLGYTVLKTWDTTLNDSEDLRTKTFVLAHEIAHHDPGIEWPIINEPQANAVGVELMRELDVPFVLYDLWLTTGSSRYVNATIKKRIDALGCMKETALAIPHE